MIACHQEQAAEPGPDGRLAGKEAGAGGDRGQTGLRPLLARPLPLSLLHMAGPALNGLKSKP